MKYTETIEWFICDVCGDFASPNMPNAIGWLIVDTSAYGIVADTRKTRHLCIVCREDFDNFWGE